MYCFVILLLFNEMQMSVRRFSAIPHLRAVRSGTRDGNTQFIKLHNISCDNRYILPLSALPNVRGGLLTSPEYSYISRKK